MAYSVDARAKIAHKMRVEWVQNRKGVMDHLAVVIKILEGAVRHDPRQSVDYALLLADKLEKEGSGRQAQLVRSELSKGPSAAMTVASADRTLPFDEESKLSTVDLIDPDAGRPELVLSEFSQERIQEFLSTVRKFDVLQAEGLAIKNRLLIYGPPGSGKTSIAKEIAAQLDLPLVVSRSDSLVSSLLGQTSRNIREIFSFASRTPCVLFLDEFDALAKNRADTREVGELQRVVIALLQNMDALSPSTVLIAATNHPELLDPAVWRRFDHQMKLSNPEFAQRESLWRSRLARFAPGSVGLRVLADASEGMSAAAIEMAAHDMVRSALISGFDTLGIPQALRRLARFMWYEQYNAFTDESQEVRLLRNWQPKVFTMRVLADEFNTHTRRIGRYLESEVT